MTPKVTVLMTVFNGEKYLEEAIDGILSQTFRDFEFLIINDGSYDGSREIIESYKDTRINLVENEQNIGLTKSLNRGLKYARGEYIARQDADDISLPERLEKQITLLEADRQISLLGSWYLEIDENGNTLREYRLPCDPVEVSWDSIFYCPFSTVVFRRERIMRDFGLYDERFKYAQDWELYSKIARDHKIVNIGECLIKYRIHSKSMTETYGAIVESESNRIRAGNLGYYLIRDSSNVTENYYRIASKMHNLLFAEGMNLTYNEIRLAVREVVRLHSAFSVKHGLDKDRSKYKLAQIYMKIAGVYSRNHSFSETAEFIMRAGKLNPSIFFSKLTLSLILRSLSSKFGHQARKVWNRLPDSVRKGIRNI